MRIESAQRTLRGQAYEILKRQLLAGELAPGERVNEVVMASQLGISRGPLREAIRKLEQEGLLTAVPQRGVFVRQLTQEEAAELQEVRLALETAAACRLARHYTAKEQALLEERLGALRGLHLDNSSLVERMTADLAFHEAICEASGNETLLETWRSLIGRITLMVLNVGPQRMSQLQDADATGRCSRRSPRATRRSSARRSRASSTPARASCSRPSATAEARRGTSRERPRVRSGCRPAISASSEQRQALPGRRAPPGRDPEHRGARLPARRGGRGGAARRPRPARVPGHGRGPADHRRAARDGGARARARIEVCLFARPNAAWGLSASARAAAGGTLAPAAWGMEQVIQQLEEIRRAAELGFRSVLIADLGVLRLFSAMREAGELPPDMQAKISVMLPAANPASARVLEDLGANTINVPVDLSLAQLAAIRAAVDVPLDVYVESPDNLGGIVRLHEIAEIVRVTAPVHVKFGLRNAPDLYPSGSHLEATAVALSRERVRRARIGLDRLALAAGY